MNNNQFNKSMQTIKNYVDENIANTIAQVLVLENVIEGETMTSVEEIISCTGLTLSSNTLTLNGLSSQTLTATRQPSNCTEEVVWSVSPSGIATVNNGVVTSIANGSCIITATCGSQSAACNVTVSGIVVLGNLVVNKTSMSIVEGHSDTFDVVLNSQPNTNQTVTISVNNSNASVNPSSLTFNSSNYNVAQTVTVTGVDNSVVGDTNNSIITIASNGVSSKTINITVTDNDGVSCTGISLDQTSLSFATESPIQLTATKTPSNTTDAVAWNVTPSGIVTVNNGLVTPVANGDAAITVTCGNQSATCNVNVSCFVTVPNTAMQVLTNSKGTLYYQINDPSLIQLLNENTNGYSDGNYNIHNVVLSTINFNFNMTDAELFMDTFEVFEGNFSDYKNYQGTGDKLVIAKNGQQWALKIPTSYEGTCHQYLAENLTSLKIKKSECNEFVIDPSLITTMTMETSSKMPEAQYAQFGYSSLPSKNIYSGLNTFSVVTGDNANLGGIMPPKAAMSTSKLSIVFLPGTFEQFTIDNVKAYLTEHPLVFYYV